MTVSSSRASSASLTSFVRRPLLSVVVPVFNGGREIVENVGIIRTAAARSLASDDVELVVVSDGSIDGTAERLLAARSDVGMRVIHYDRNLGKGYAVKVGALAAAGEWIAIVDADLDLDPAAVPVFLEVARREGLDLAVGSKRHPDSVVHYPVSRKLASWCYQQLNRALFRLDVRDTQVGLKVFRREVADEVVPLLLVKQYAFDLELLAVANALGFRRVRELPIRLEYRFTGSGIRSSTVARALWDTAAVFYRLRVLRTYQRKRRLLRGASVPPEGPPLVTVVGPPGVVDALDYPRVETAPEGNGSDPVAGFEGELVAVVAPDARPAGNWVTAAVPYFASDGVAAVVVPTLAPAAGALRERVAAAVLESRLGGGSRRFHYLPGNVRAVSDYPAASCVIRRDDYLAAGAAGVDGEHLVSWLAARGRQVIYTPDSSVVESASPLLLPHVRDTLAHARVRGAIARSTAGRSMSGATLLSLSPALLAAAGFALVVSGRGRGGAGVRLVGVYGVTLGVSSIAAAVRFRSAAVGLLTAPALAATQAAYMVGFVHGLVRDR